MKKKEEKFGGFVKPLTEVIEKGKSKITITEKEFEEKVFITAEKNLHEYLDDLIHTAKWIVRDLEGYKVNLNQAKAGTTASKFTTQEAVIGWAMNRVQQINWHFNNGARFVGNYMEAKTKRGE